MRICHVTPHLPPDQAANALLPFHLGTWAVDTGDEPSYLAHPPRAAGTARLPGPVTWIADRRRTSRVLRTSRLSSIAQVIRVLRRALPGIGAADVVHVHGNGLLAEVGALAAGFRGRPVILTLYGTEIWHYRPRRIDLFRRIYQRAAFVTFYSHGLSAKATALGLGRPDTQVVYPPVAPQFRHHGFSEQRKVRSSLGLRQRHVLINVKRLHPLAGQRVLIEALGEVIRTHQDTQLIICGAGPLLEELQSIARTRGVEGHVVFAGLVDNETVARYCAAADLFVLPSLLEACPTVALEALASGTPVLTSDNPGGQELHDLFGSDVSVVPKGQPLTLARGIVGALDRKHRTCGATADTLAREFSPAVVAGRFRSIYERALARSPRSR